MKAALSIAVALLAVLCLATAAQAEKEIEGNLIVTFDGGITPRALPRSGTAPVTVTVGSHFEAADGAVPPPQLRTIAIAINKGGEIFDRGLPTCRIRSIQPGTLKAARRTCGGAIVGSGRVQVLVNLPNQPSFTFEGPLLVFNAKGSGSHRRLLAQIYGRKPPSAFVLTFRIVETQGTFGTVIKTTLPKTAHRWAYVLDFEMKLRRIYTYGGETRSFVSASCAAPEGFPGAIYPFARATFGFAGGKQVSTAPLLRDCIVR